MKKYLYILFLVLFLSFVSAESYRSDNLIYGEIDGIPLTDIRSSTNWNYNKQTGNMGIILVGRDGFGRDYSLRTSARITNVVGNEWFKEIYAEANYATITKDRNREIIKNPWIRAFQMDNRLYVVIFDSTTGNVRSYSLFYF